MSSSGLYKGFTCSHLEWAFGVRFSIDGVAVPYYGVNGDLYREKLFAPGGRPLRWLGESKPQVPYGLETLRLGGEFALLTEGESCAWALRAAFSTVPVLAVPGASGWKAEWLSLLTRFTWVYLSFDNDEAGLSLLDEVWAEVGSRGRRVRLPAERDTRDLLQLYGGKEAYECLLDDADRGAELTAAFDALAGANRKEAANVAA